MFVEMNLPLLKWIVWWKIFLKMANGLSWNGKTLLDFVDADFFM